MADDCRMLALFFTANSGSKNCNKIIVLYEVF